MRFSDMVDRKAEDIKAPPALPAGSYIFQVKQHPDQDEIKGKDGTNYDRLVFQCTVISAEEVDEDALADYGNVAGAPQRVTFMFNTEEGEDTKREGSLNRLKTFLTACGCFEEGMTVGEGLAASPGTQFRGEVTHRLDPNDSERVFAEINRTYAL